MHNAFHEAPLAGRSRRTIVLLLLLLGLAACSSMQSFEFLSRFVDGVPDPNDPANQAAEPKPAPLVAVKSGPPKYLHRPYAENKCAKCHASRIGKPNTQGSNAF